MKYAIIENEIVSNIAESDRQIETNWVSIPTGCPVAIGDSYDGSVFKSPEGVMRMPPETAALASLLEAMMGGVADA